MLQYKRRLLGRNHLPKTFNILLQLYTEYSLLNYFRQFQLGEEAAQENISADLKNGTMIIHVPKAEKDKPKQIKVNVT